MSELSLTLLLMTHNQGPYLAAALESVLAQERRPDRILIADNGSSDATGDVLEAFLRRQGARGDLVMRRLPYVGGPSALINALAKDLSGDIVVFQAGDDIAESQRTARLEELFARDPALLAAHSAVRVIDPAGRPLEQLDYALPTVDQARYFARVQGHVLGAGLAIRRRLLEAFPPLDDGAFEDTLLPFRAALLGRVGYAPEALVRYRRHPGNVTHALHDNSSVAAVRRASALSLQRLRHIAELRRQDIAHVLRLAPERRSELEPLYAVVDSSLDEAEARHALDDPRLRRRLWGLRSLLRLQPTPRMALLAATHAFWPGLYYGYRRRRSRRQGA
jgi:glycosyltransferase involved in cell wall biosynthesis